jgi:hypothetical protein
MRSNGRNISVLITLAWILFSGFSLSAQSTNQEFPSPVTTNEISGTIRPRDIGDSRLTSYYYQFDGSQGDLFINLVTKNFTGDIDVFIQNGLRPLTKIVVYADLAETETGRVIYLRKPEKMLLRVQGRTPSDDVATFRIKFAGSFVGSSLPEPAAEPSLPTLTARNESGIRVNSVGTIVEVIPKPTPVPPAEKTVAEREEPTPKQDAEKKDEVAEKIAEPQANDEKQVESTEKKVGVVVTDNIPEKTVTPPASRGTSRSRRRTAPPKAGTANPSTTPEKVTTPPARTTTARTRRERSQARTEPAVPDPLEKINLVILFKDSTTITRPLSEVLRFTVDKGMLTVIAKDGSIGRYSMLDVLKVTIE